MYINQFLAGVIATLFVEFAAMFVWALISGGKR